MITLYFAVDPPIVRWRAVEPCAVVPERSDWELAMALCPECDAELDIDEFDADKGEVFSCSECGSNLQIVSLSPLEVEVVSDDDDDEDEDDDFEDEDDDEELDEDDESEDEDWDR